MKPSQQRALLTTLLTTVCGGLLFVSDASAAPAKDPIKAPEEIQAKGKLTFCSDLENPPAEGMASDGKTPVGAAVDIMKALGDEMGVKSQIDNYQFSGIFAALDTGKCDLIIASLGNTPERAQRYWMVDYWRVNTALLVPKGNPLHLASYEDLSGRSVAALLGSRNAGLIKQISDKLVSENKKPIEQVLLGTNVAAFQNLGLKRVDAFASDSLVINYYLSKGRSRFELVGVPVPPKTWSIAITKANVALKDAVQASIDRMNSDGQMAAITKKWGIEDGVGLCSSAHSCE
ncbi:ABC transporter substrate-binding protein [Sodalis sp. RH21]|uniref:ABC transporter substrate-binding protein n=1 Tax=unclassified Sodalis (in: enterobacteria) TaxID=2636512 RepID=UPI0039B47F52